MSNKPTTNTPLLANAAGRALSGRILAKFVVASFYTFCVALTIVGYQALLPVLLSERVYAYVCSSPDAPTPVPVTPTPTPAADGQVCLAQKLQLDLMFTLATSALNIVGLVVGVCMMRYGPRVTCIVGCVVIASGSLAFALSTDAVPLWTAGYVAMGAGGPFVAFSVFSLAGLAPAYAAVVIAVFVGVFDASASMMLFMKLLHTQLGWTVRQLFSYYLVFPCTLIPVAFWLFPSTSENQDNDHSVQSSPMRRLTIDSGATPTADNPYAPDAQAGDYAPVEPSAGEQVSNGGGGGGTTASPLAWYAGEASLSAILRSGEFWLVAVWSAALISSNYFYIQNVSDQLTWVLNGAHSQIDTAINFFSVVLPAAGLATPITGFILQRYGVRTAVAINGILCLVLSVLSCWRGSPIAVQYMTLVIVCFNRFLYFSTAPVLLGQLFGSVGPSAVYPVVFAVAGVVNLLDFAWTYICKHDLDGSFLVFNATLNGGCVVACALVFVQIGRWSARVQREAALLDGSDETSYGGSH